MKKLKTHPTPIKPAHKTAMQSAEHTPSNLWGRLDMETKMRLARLGVLVPANDV